MSSINILFIQNKPTSTKHYLLQLVCYATKLLGVSNFIDLNATIVPWMARTTKMVGIYLSDVLNKHQFDLTRTQWVLLKWLHEEDGQRQNDLALITGRNKASLTRLVQTMERKALVTRETDEYDKRSNRVYLTDNGRHLYQSTVPIVYEALNNIQQNLSQQEIGLLIQAMQKIQQTIQQGSYQNIDATEG